MKTIPVQFAHDGFNLRLLKRTGDVALFAKSKPTHSRDTFEVVLIQHHPAESICGRAYPARESMPPSESWGTLGWSYPNLEDAQEKFRALVQGRREGHSQPSATPARTFSCASGISAGNAAAERAAVDTAPDHAAA